MNEQTTEISYRVEGKRIYSAELKQNIVAECLAGANDYVSKPVDLEKLLSLISSSDTSIGKAIMGDLTFLSGTFSLSTPPATRVSFL